MNVFGFSTEVKGGDFLPVLRYDARAGRFFRVERADNGSGFASSLTDITANFKAVFDFENIEIGWIQFAPGMAPSFVMVPMGQQRPPRPTEQHKDGIRFLVKLAKQCVGPEGKPVREVAGTAKAFQSGIEAVYLEYLKYKDQNPGKLPVLVLERTTPVKTGGGTQSSTNYSPVFRIEGWVPRGDLQPQPRANGSGQQPQHDAAPATGATTRSAPAPVSNIADEF
jgi:hypothetical protein